MKPLLIILFLTLTASAQNVLVKFYPVNQPFAGLTNYPQGVLPVSWSTNTAGWDTNMTVANYSTYLAQFATAYNAGVSNAQFVITSGQNTNYALWLATYQQIPQGITDSSNRMVTLTNLYTSWRSGTNNAAGTNNIIMQCIQQQYWTYVYLNQLIQYLSRLGPGLQQIYQPGNDPVGH